MSKVWKQKDKKLKTIKDVVLHNTKQTEKEFFNKKKNYIDQTKEAASMIKHFIEEGEQITIFGDYDVDGITSSGVLDLAITELGGLTDVIFPKRFSEGFGISEKAVEKINDGLLITVDNGIAGVEAVRKAKEKGITVIITDHHQPNDDGIFPPADIIINPNAIEGSCDFNGFCGAGIACKLSEELLGEGHPLLKRLVSLAAIGTIADVMNLVGENRLIVIEGLKELNKRHSDFMGIDALLEVLELESITATTIGFKIGPILNAVGRLYDDGAKDAFELLKCKDRAEAANLANKLVAINENRKDIVNKWKKIADEKLNVKNEPIIIAYLPGVPEGIVGILAGRLKEEYDRPTIVFSDAEEKGILKGSGRSTESVDMKALLDKASELLYKYGGHEGAAGLSIKKCDYESLIRVLNSLLGEYKENDLLYYDLEISVKDIPKALKELDKFAPFGAGNPNVIFKIKDFDLIPKNGLYYKPLGVIDGKYKGVKLFGDKVSALDFEGWKKYCGMGNPKTLELLGTLSINSFKGYVSNQIEIVDMIDGKREAKKTSLAEALDRKAKERVS